MRVEHEDTVQGALLAEYSAEVLYPGHAVVCLSHQHACVGDSLRKL